MPRMCKYQPAQARFPLMQSDLRPRPWSKLGTDIFEYGNNKYLIVVDYYCRYMVVRKLVDIRAETVCTQLKGILDEFGTPNIVADCGAQYMSESFKQKCRDANIDIQFS